MNPTNKKSKKYVVAFKGLNYGEGYEDGEFSDAKNISLDEFPCLTQRHGRITSSFEYGDAKSLCYKDGKYGGLFIATDSTVTRYGEYNPFLVSDPFVKKVKKQMVGVGNYLIIFPDKKYYNVETGELDSMELTYKWSSTFTSSEIVAAGTGCNFPFKKGDTVVVSGSARSENNKSVTIREYSPHKLTFDANAFTEDKTAVMVTVTRTVPDLDYICESNYRLWGVSGNTIYGSKYMDPLNFQSFDGSSGDSYAIDVGSGGKFTGCIPYTSHICFFKENMLHKLYGSKPSNFQLVNSQVYGVQDGSEGSMCIVNETLYYKGVNGVYAYNGGIPSLVSGKFGRRMFDSACATTDGDKYYIAMRDVTSDKQEDRTYGVYVYDIRKNSWAKEDNLDCVDMAYDLQGVWMLTDPYVYLVQRGESYDVTSDGNTQIPWSVTFCPFNEVMNERKGYSKFHMRLDLSEGASLLVEVKRNNDSKWNEVKTIKESSAQTVTIPILPKRCDSVEIRLSGKGVCKLRTFIREFYVGSDV